ncbi:MAG: hypothetical protein A3G81_04690 [Betaproteobacteria bacterium RIFCSPLOWO2_12_FULL_65_14]|nr:MAG: hypothetical protein A3G81_04690 [Betaproteobacteria bacterium RIFCSPLOWO2_12_FULL_65_14]
MKKLLSLTSGAVIIAALAGCAIVPYPEPAVVYAAPPPRAAIIVQPSYGYYHGYRGGRHWRRWH